MKEGTMLFLLAIVIALFATIVTGFVSSII